MSTSNIRWKNSTPFNLYRVECPVKIILVNHELWHGRWVIPANDGVQVPELFLDYARTLPLQQPESSCIEGESTQGVMLVPYHRVDVYLPDALFKSLCMWLHFEAPKFTCDIFPHVYLKRMIEKWNIPKVPYLGDKEVSLMNKVILAWNQIPLELEQPSSNPVPRLIKVLGEKALKERVGFSSSKTNLNVATELKNTFKYHLETIKSTSCKTIHNHLPFCSNGFEIAEQIINIKKKILSQPQYWWDEYAEPKIPVEVETIAQLIALNKNIPVDEALTYCTKPLDKLDAFWDNIETHIGVNSWNILKKLHANGDIKVRTSTLTAFLESLPEETYKLDGSEMAEEKTEAIEKILAIIKWADEMQKLTRPMSNWKVETSPSQIHVEKSVEETEKLNSTTNKLDVGSIQSEEVSAKLPEAKKEHTSTTAAFVFGSTNAQYDNISGKCVKKAVKKKVV